MLNASSISNTDYASLQNSISLLAAQKTFKTGSASSDASGDYSTDAIKKTSQDDAAISISKKDKDSADSDISTLIKNGSSVDVNKNIEAKTKDADKTGKLGKSADSSDSLIAYGKKEEDDSEYYYSKSVSAVTTSFNVLAAEVGAVGDKVSKTQLMAYLETLKSNSSGSNNSQEIALVKNLIARFDTLADSDGYITSLDGIKEAQDYTTVTPEQVTPPFNIAI